MNDFTVVPFKIQNPCGPTIVYIFSLINKPTDIIWYFTSLLAQGVPFTNIKIYT